MTNDNSAIKKRFKAVREALNLSQTELANAIYVNKTAISKIESDKEPKRIPTLKIIMALEDLFNVNRFYIELGDEPMFLLNRKKTNHSQNNAKPLHEVHYPIEPGESPFIDMGNGQYTMLIPKVEEYSYGSFPSGFRDYEWVETLPKVAITVNKQHSGTYFAFEVIGDSMENYQDKESAKKSIEDGATVVGREIPRDYWKSKLHYHKWNAFVVVHKEYGIACKTILDHDVENGIIHLSSYNPDKLRHKDFAWHLDEIQAIYNIVRIINEV